MKKILYAIFIVLLAVPYFRQNAFALTYQEAVNFSKPMAIVIYAPWADDKDAVLKIFNDAEKKYGSKYNFVSINIAEEEAKTFNQTYPIYSKIPYVLLFKDRGRINRYIQKNCILDKSCFDTRLDLFNQ